MNRQHGFTLIELIAVILIIAVLSISLTTSLTPSALQQLQAAKSVTLNALVVAQQKAMSQTSAVRFSSTGNTLNITVGGASVRTSGTLYPLTLPGNVSVSTQTVDYNRLGHTNATTLVLSLGDRSTTINISGTGYAY